MEMPDDLMFTYHVSDGLPPDTEYLVRLDAQHKVQQVVLVAGFSAYFPEEAKFIEHKVDFSDQPGSIIRVHIPDPAGWIEQQEVQRADCTDAMASRDLYLVAAHAMKAKDDKKAHACYASALAKSPQALAARYGFALSCPLNNTACSVPVLHTLIEEYPSFADARWMLSLAVHPDSDVRVKIADDSERLQHPVSQEMRADLSGVLLEEQLNVGNVAAAADLAENWRQAVLQWIAVDPSLRSSEELEANAYGKIEEGMGRNTDALENYQLSLYLMDKSGTKFQPSARFEFETAYARILKKAGNSSSAQTICDAWRNRWPDVVQWKRPHVQGERQSDLQEEIEARWEYSCGDPETARQLLTQAQKKYPFSLSLSDAWEEYYLSRGQTAEALSARAMGIRLQMDPTSIPGYPKTQ